MGPGFRELNKICLVQYEKDDALVLSNPVIIREGPYLRLGHLREGRLISSDGFKGPHQPFKTDDALYFTNGAPNGRIYKNCSVFIDHWDDFVEVTNPWVDGEDIYFEARREHNEAPEGWELWRADIATGVKQRICDGANPCVYKGHLYYSVWNGESFDVAERY